MVIAQNAIAVRIIHFGYWRCRAKTNLASTGRTEFEEVSWFCCEKQVKP